MDLEALFKEYLKQFADSDYMSYIEDDLPDIYRKWLNMSNDKLNGIKPGQLLNWKEQGKMIETFLLYYEANLRQPEQLLDAIVDTPECEDGLIEIISGILPAPPEARILALELLYDLGSSRCMPIFLEILDQAEESELTDLAVDLIASKGYLAVDYLLNAIDKAASIGADRICGIISDMPPDDKIFRVLLSRFEDESNDPGYYASLLRRFGDPRALPSLECALSAGRAKTYSDFVSFADAIESFGGTVGVIPDYPDDPDFIKSKETRVAGD